MILQVAAETAGRKFAACFPGIPDAICEWLSVNYDKSQPAGAFGFHLFDIINAVLLFYTIILIKQSIRQANEQHANNSEDFVKSLVDTRYDALDRLYFDLLKERRERAYTPELAPANDPYPLMVWNFIETIIDKCREDLSGNLARTWSPIMASEARAYGAWLQQSKDGVFANAIHFKRDFFALANALISAAADDAKNGNEFDGLAFLRLCTALERLAQSGIIQERVLPELLASSYSQPVLREQAAWQVPRTIGADENPHDRKQRRQFQDRKLAELVNSLRETIAKNNAA